MNDTVRKLASCGLLLLVACSGDPTLDVSVHHPADYQVTQTRVTVYFGDDISCSQIAFGDRTEAELAAITVDEVDVTKGGHVEVSRLGGKSLVARGFDAEQRFVTAGCKDIGEVTAGTKVAIDTQPTAVVAVDPGQPDRPFTGRPILVTMSDTSGMPLDGTVSWLLTGPAGAPEQPPSTGIATRNGDATIRVDDLGTPGPEGLRIRVPWATAPLPLVTGFDLSHATMLSLGGGSLGGHPSCDVRGHAGKPSTLVCLNQANLQGHRDVVEIAWQDNQKQYLTTIPPGQPAINDQFALFVDHNGDPDEPVYVLSANATGAGTWYKLGAASGTSTTFVSELQNVVYIPQCEANQFNLATALVAVQTGPIGLANKVQLFTPTGASVLAAQPGEILSGGCLADVDKNEHQAAVVSDGISDASLRLITKNPATPIIISGSRLVGSGFVTVETQGVTEKRFAGTRLQASGTVVFEAVLAPDAGSFKLVERAEVDAAAPPARIIGGKLDRDGDTDLMWDMALGARRQLFQVSLAKQVGGVPLTAMTSGPAASATTSASLDFLAADLSGHGADEMIVFTATTVTIYSPDE